MKHIAIIQKEFLKEARKWEDLSYEEQKGYLSRHPKSKRKITAKPDNLKEESKPKREIKEKQELIQRKKNYLKKLKLLNLEPEPKQENSSPTTIKDVEEQQRKNLTDLQKFGIASWGALLYLSYDLLPDGPDNSKQIKPYAKEYVQALKDNDEDTLEDLNDWIEEGMSVSGKKLLTKQTYDSIMESIQTKIPEDMVVYKYGDPIKHQKNRWLSFTNEKGSHSHLGQETKFVLKKGTPVIFSNGFADKSEVILNSKYI